MRAWRLRGAAATLLGLILSVLACATFQPREGWNAAHGLVVPHDTFPAACDLCHQTGNWHTLKPEFAFDHTAQTGVALEGAHATAQCLRCHNDRGPVSEFSRQGCAGCHTDPHRGQLGRSCDHCHDQRTWWPQQAIANHNDTRFPLVGAHASVECQVCHSGAQTGNFTGLDTACASCHLRDWQRTTAPVHQTAGWGTNCEQCHTTLGWGTAVFTHPWFPINSGKHKGYKCVDCHLTPGTFTAFSCTHCHKHRQSEMSGAHSSVGGYVWASPNCYACHPNGSK